MNNVFEKIRGQLLQVVKEAFTACENKGSLPRIQVDDILIEIPRERDFGDFSTNIAMKISKQAKMPPRKTAELLVSEFDFSGTYIEKIEIQKREGELKKKIIESQQFEEKVQHIADSYIGIDLDDGVKENYKIFKDVLAKIK